MDQIRTIWRFRAPGRPSDGRIIAALFVAVLLVLSAGYVMGLVWVVAWLVHLVASWL